MDTDVTHVRARDWALDLDGTLVAGDTLVESIVALLLRRPWRLVGLIPTMLRGRAAFKRAVAALAPVDPELLPYRKAVLEYAERCKAAGASLHIVTASDQTVADRIARHLGIFDSAMGSDGKTNLKGEAKARMLGARFPEGFGYVGDERSDRPVWRAARERAVVSRDDARANDLIGARDQSHETIGVGSASVRDWLSTLRLHHWTKNLMLFVPWFLAQQFNKLEIDAFLLAAFVAFGLLASAGYLVNDLSDLNADRAHPRKRTKAIAAGRIGTGTALALAGVLAVSGLTLAAAIPGDFVYFAASYLALSVAYSISLKQKPMTDILVIGALITLRLIAGMVILDQRISLWLSSFGFMLFCSLAFAKRSAELARAAASGKAPGRRAYEVADQPLLTVFGVSAALVSVLVLVLYFQLKAMSTGLYDDVEWLYAAPVILFSWLTRIWIYAHRGKLHDDPIVFALKDWPSWGHGIALLLFWSIADKPGFVP
jgi:4-hydroxybenzoate polyprenyltransferase